MNNQPFSIYLGRLAEVALARERSEYTNKDFNAVIRQVAPEFASSISPIELMMGAALAIIVESTPGEWGGRFFTSPGMKYEQCESMALDGGVDVGFVVFPQVRVGKYTVDFLCRLKGSYEMPPIMVAIECDGHEFHERTKAQAAHDKARDRYLQTRNIPVLRYTGAEIWADPMGTAFSATHSAVRILLERNGMTPPDA